MKVSIFDRDLFQFLALKRELAEKRCRDIEKVLAETITIFIQKSNDITVLSP